MKIDNWNGNKLPKFKKQLLRNTFELEKQKLKRGQIEIQIWIDNYATGKNRLLCLNKDEKENWIGKSFRYYFYNKEHSDLEDFTIKDMEFKAQWEDDWDIIKSRKYLNINTQNKIEEELQKFITSEEVLIIADGIGYTISLREKNKLKLIKYDNPELKSEFYKRQKIKVAEYEKVSAFLKIIFDNFDE